MNEIILGKILKKIDAMTSEEYKALCDEAERLSKYLPNNITIKTENNNYYEETLNELEDTTGNEYLESTG